MNDDGVVSVLMLAQLALAGLLCLAITDAGAVLLAKSRAQTAADAAALAAAAAQWRTGDVTEDPADAARDVAEANGATLETCECPTRGEKAVVFASRATRIHLLGVAPRHVSARAEARLDIAMLFEP